MGIISLEKQDHLFWLGRYSERVFTTIRTFLLGYDQMLDDDTVTYQTICTALDIPDMYGSQENFIKNYIYAAEDANSIYTNLRHAYDNAVVLRDEISSDSLSYIQMALDVMESHRQVPLSLLSLQQVLDILFAFWGSIDDLVLSENTRNILKAGRYLERVDLYVRLNYPQESIVREFTKLEHRMSHLTTLQYDAALYQQICIAMGNNRPMRQELNTLNNVFSRQAQ